MFDEYFTECPVGRIDGEAAEIVNIIEMSEGGGMGGGWVSPSLMLQESMTYWNCRRIVLHEKNKIDRWRKAHEKKEGK